jgi:hypothetical protein
MRPRCYATPIIGAEVTSDNGYVYVYSEGGWIRKDIALVRMNDTLMDLEQVEYYCEQYPALNTAFVNFKLLYDMIRAEHGDA